MQINKWHRHLKLFAWQHRRSLMLTAMFVVALLLSVLLFAPAALPILSLLQWPTELWYLIGAGFLVCVVVVLVLD